MADYEDNPELAAEAAQIKQRQMIAQAMLARGMTPVEPQIEQRTRTPLPFSWTQGLAQLANAYYGREGLKKAAKEADALSQKQKAGEAKAVADYLRTRSGTEAAPAVARTFNTPSGPQQVGTEALVDQPIDPRKAIADLLASPYTPQGVKALALQENAPYNLSPGEVRKQNGQTVAEGAAAPLKTEQPLDELAKLNADLKAGRISQKDYDARYVLMTTRAPQLGAIGPGENDEIDRIAKATANYQLPPPSGGNRSPRGAAILAKALEYNPKYQAQEYGSRNSAYKAFASGKQGDQVRSFNVAISHLNTADDLIDALANGDTVAINRLSQLWKQQTGSAAPTNLATARAILRGEVVKSISGAGGGVEDRQSALAGLADGASAEQMHGAVQVAQRLMGGQLGGLKRQFEHSTGRNDFESMLSPDALPFLATPEAKGNENQTPKGGFPTIKSDAEYNALPSGADFLDPNGDHRVKP